MNRRVEDVQYPGYIVYLYWQPQTDKMYVGITKHGKIAARALNGRGYINKCPHLSAAIEKYGWDSFAKDVLQSGLTKKEAEEWERYYIAKWDLTNPEKGYNIQVGGLSAGGMSEDGKASLRAHNTGLNANNQRPVVAFNTEGTRLAEFPLVTFAAEHYGIKRGTLENHLRKPKGTCHGMIFKYAEDVSGLSALTPEMLHKALHKKPIAGEDSFLAKPVAVFDCVTGKRIADFGCVNDARAFCGGDVSGVLSGRQTTCGGKYICRYAHDVVGVEALPQNERYDPKLAPPNHHKEIQQFSLDGSLIAKFLSLEDASRSTGIGRSAISLCALGKTKSSGGFVWRYVNGGVPFRRPTSSWETRRKIGKTNGKSVDQLDLCTGEVIQSFLSINDAARDVGSNKSQISKVCRHINGAKSAAGYGWRYHEE